MFDIGGITCSYRINEGSKTALSLDLQNIMHCEVNLNISNA